MSKETLIEKLCELAAEQAAVAPATLNLDTHFQADLNFDSLDSVEFTMKVEEAFDIHIADEQADAANTIGDVAVLLEQAQVAAEQGKTGR